MRERALSLGGTLAIDSVPGQGTTVRLTLPAGALGETQQPTLVEAQV
jgi:signal transduction histidine kinase